MQEKSNITLSDILRILKEKKEVSLNQIQVKTGLSKSYLSRLASGDRDNPSLQVLMKLADFFDMDVSDLLNNEVLIVSDDEQEDKEEIIINTSLKQEVDRISKEIWNEIVGFCNKEVTTRQDEISILNKIDKLKSLNKKLS